MKGEKNPMYNKHHTEENRKMIGTKNSQHMLERKKRLGYVNTQEARRKMSESSKGEKGSNYIDGRTSINENIRKSLEYRLWRKAIFERDNFTCQKCKQSGGILRAHHIFNFADYPERRTEIANGITFCKECHHKFHKMYGTKNNTKKQLEAFLT